MMGDGEEDEDDDEDDDVVVDDVDDDKANFGDRERTPPPTSCWRSVCPILVVGRVCAPSKAGVV